MQRFYPSAMFQSLSLAVVGVLRIPPCHDEGLGFFHLGKGHLPTVVLIRS